MKPSDDAKVVRASLQGDQKVLVPVRPGIDSVVPAGYELEINPQNPST